MAHLAGRADGARSGFRIAVVDDHRLVAEALELALSVEGYDARVVPLPMQGTSPAALLTQVARLRPRLVLLDLDLGRSGDGSRLVRPLASAGVDVVVVTGSADRGRWGEAVLHGARTVLPKATPLPGVLSVVRRLRAGQAVSTVEERERLLAAYREMRAGQLERRQRLERLTRRERLVLGELMAGRTVAEIARRAVVTEATVRTQVKSILAKLGVSSQLAAVGLAHDLGWSAS
jgi:two-component system, NarL family, nitrate/nitrite response regulator NarL